MSRLTRCVFSLCYISILTCLPLASSYAVNNLAFEIKKLHGNNWLAQSIRLHLSITDDRHVSLVANIDKLTLPKPIGILNKLKLTCKRLEITREISHCKKGELHVNDSRLDKNRIKVAFRYNFANNNLKLDATRIPIAGGLASIQVNTGPHKWNLDIKGKQLDTKKITALAKQLNLANLQYEITSNINLHAVISGTKANVKHISIKANTPSLAFSDATGEIAGEELSINVAANIKPSGRPNSPLSFDTNITATRGTVCFDACWTIPEQAVSIIANGLWFSDKGLINLKKTIIKQAGILEASGSAMIQTKNKLAIETLSFHLNKTPSQNLYNTYLQPVLIGTIADDMGISGYTSADIEIRKMKISKIKLELSNTHINDNKKRFGIFGLSGDIHWNNSSNPSLSNLDWQGGYLYSLPFGVSKINIESINQSYKVKEAISLPIFDGTLKIDDFSMSNPGKPDMQWQFDGVITPISMVSFSQSIGWPEMSGKLSGIIPKVTYSNGSLEVGGVLLVRAFDGNITIRNLKMERLLDITPILNADITLDKLDLESLTSTFSFGKIQGRVSGYVNHLNMVDWKPVAFNAKLATPENDDSRHRISQKAVDNLTNIGGGGFSGAISRSFLGIFKEFSYKHLGIGCILENNICTMSGVAPATNGYYIVQGGFLPRIDIIGFADKVDWDSLVDRLQNITSTNGPVVQ